MTKSADNKSTRYYSDIHEKSVCKALSAKQQPNSGAGLWRKGDVIQEIKDVKLTEFGTYKGDVIQEDSSLLIECKCSMKSKSSFAVRKEWIDKNRKEAFFHRLSNTAICINFEPNGDNYYVIDEKLMKLLCEKLREY